MVSFFALILEGPKEVRVFGGNGGAQVPQGELHHHPCAPKRVSSRNTEPDRKGWVRDPSVLWGITGLARTICTLLMTRVPSGLSVYIRVHFTSNKVKDRI